MEEDIKIKYENQLKRIKNYIAICPGIPKFQVSLNTGVSIEIIRELIEAGLLTEENSELKVARKQRFESQERKELIQRLRQSVDQEGFNTEKNTEKTSKLVDDLKQKRSDRGR